MKLFKKENGTTLIELIIVLAITSIILVLIGTIYLSVNKSYIRADKKAQNLEEARVIIDHITDNFQSSEKCEVTVEDGVNEKIEEVVVEPDDDDGFRTVKNVEFSKYELKANGDIEEIIFGNVKYEQTGTDPAKGTLTWKKNNAGSDIGSEVAGFKARLDGDLLEFKIEMINEGHGVVADQKLDVSTTLNLQYMQKDPVTP